MKVGDKVRVRADLQHRKHGSAADCRGVWVIVEIAKDNMGDYGLCPLKEWNDGTVGMRYLNESELELPSDGVVAGQQNNASTPWQVGDAVRIKSGLTKYRFNASMGAGHIGTVAKVDKDGTVRVCNHLYTSGLWFDPSEIERVSITQNLGGREAYPTERTEQTMVYKVSIIATPSVIAQQNGAVEEVILDTLTVVANDPTAAAFVAGVTGEVEAATIKGKTLKAVVTTLG